jgi:hypothetical protein
LWEIRNSEPGTTLPRRFNQESPGDISLDSIFLL